MKKNGFIATTLVYSFFLVFCAYKPVFGACSAVVVFRRGKPGSTVDGGFTD